MYEYNNMMTLVYEYDQIIMNIDQISPSQYGIHKHSDNVLFQFFMYLYVCDKFLSF